ncbi:acyltransferase [Ramlibacter ginsenosidimutans]|uniref:Acyltransferase n=1 Tax=Ramlibacter ginsenosidimutans TaxID=502333 RepID=A0A934WLP1_9BURK|nr:acyltransferase [Ramlibacter ginsenosidimutans]MBK6005766.1 acyltransferase [Ramlibacter ginsenosidimutans]
MAARSLGAPGLQLGPGCELIGVRHIRWGRDVSVRSGLWLEAVTSYRAVEFEPRIVIGNRVSFSHGVHLSAIEAISVGDDVLFGSLIFVADHQHGTYSGTAQSTPDEPPSNRPLVLRGPVVIEDNVWIGDGAHILGPARIGRGAVIGAHAVVRGDVPAGAMVAGAPAVVVRVFDGATATWIRPIRGGPGPVAGAAAPQASSIPS